MFIGAYNHSMDEKGRVRIPKNFREELGETFYVTGGFDKCLFVFSEDEWQKFQMKLNSNQLKDKNFRRLQRFFAGLATECTLDGQGRVILSQRQREYATIEKDIVVMGVSDRIEMWSQEAYDLYMNDGMDDISDIADVMNDLDL